MLDPHTRDYLRAASYCFSDREAFIADLSRDDVWLDPDDADIPADRLTLLGSIYDLTHATVRGLCKQYSLSHAQFAARFCIPLRTVDNWCTGERKAPAYVVAMAAELLAADVAARW